MGYIVNLLLEGKPAVVVGGGKVASRKVADLLSANALVTVVAPGPVNAIRLLAERKEITGCWREYRTSDLYGAYLVIAAADDEAVNAHVHKDAQALGILINVVDRPALCSFTVPATVRRGSLSISVATGGLCPAFSGVLREELESRYGPEFAELVQLVGDLRKQMLALGWDGERIRAATAQLYRDGIAETIVMRDRRLLCDFIRVRLGPELDVHPSVCSGP